MRKTCVCWVQAPRSSCPPTFEIPCMRASSVVPPPPPSILVPNLVALPSADTTPWLLALQSADMQIAQYAAGANDPAADTQHGAELDWTGMAACCLCVD